MTVRELREKYLRFFESKGHQVFPSGSLIPYDVTGRLDESLLFNGAGMVQFKPYFRGVAQPPLPRLTNAQKCVRTGDIDEVGDLSHLTFFEMLGNFSFGDYFKKEAIAFSWEFLTSPEWLGLEPARLSFTVFEDDNEAFGYWSEHISAAGLDPLSRIFRLGEETNYWPAGAFSKGPPGPCGPNSEMFYWVADTPPPSGAYTREDWLRDDEANNWLEIWNDVFIQYEWQGQLRNPERPSDGYEKTGMPPLPFQSIDTGMGLERTAAVLGGFKSVYDTDAFTAIVEKIEEIAGKSYKYGNPLDQKKDVAARIISDHIRTACFCIADGVLPGNTGRGYVLRRLIRRAVLKGQRVLGFEEPFFHRVCEGVVEAMGNHYTELVERRDVIVETLRNEEDLFRRTLKQGEIILEQHLYNATHGPIEPRSGVEMATRVLPGNIAFMLYDTYGFPLEVTKELCEEAGVRVDEEGYEQALKEAQERSRGGQDRESVYGGVGDTIIVQLFGNIQFEEPKAGGLRPTHFLGYDSTRAQSKVLGAMALKDLPGNEDAPEDRTLVVALEETPFYAESGGQVADTGVLMGGGFEGRVTDVIKQDGVFVHEVEPLKMPFDVSKLKDVVVEAEVDKARRARITRNHTATHLLHAALRQVLGKHVTQAGSYVGPDRLRFDFTHGAAMTEEQKLEVERIVNDKVLENLAVVTYADLPIADAKAMGAMALFGEKYGNTVRMVQIGDEDPSQPSFSRELCGGIHVRTTGEIGLFKIVSESSAASGVRRIEALTGEGSYEWVLEQTHLVREAAERLKSTPKDLVHAMEKLLEQLRDLRHRLEKARSQGAASSAATFATVGSVELAVANLGEGEQGDATRAADQLVEGKPNRVALAAVALDGKILFVCKVGPDALAAGAHAGNLLREVAKIAGGGGGGKPDFATAGGKDVSKVAEALAAAEGVLRGQVS